MDRNSKWQNGKSWSRASDIEVSSDFKQMVEKIALSHLAVGNSDDYMLAMNSLAKTNARVEIEQMQQTLTHITNKLGINEEGS